MHGHFYPPHFWQQYPPQQIFYADPWLANFNRNNSQTKELDKQTTLHMLIRMKELLSLMEAFNELKAPSASEKENNTCNQREYKVLASQFYLPHSQPNALQFTPAFNAFRIKNARKQRKYRWRKKKRKEWITNKPQRDAKNKELTQAVDCWFDQQTKIQQEQRLRKKQQKERAILLRRQRRELVSKRKQLAFLLPIYLKRTNASKLSEIIERAQQTPNKPITSDSGPMRPNDSPFDRPLISSKQKIEDMESSMTVGHTEGAENVKNLISHHVYYHLPQIDIKALVHIRQQWDTFLVPHGTNAEASRIPQHFVTAPEPPSNAWMPFVHYQIAKK